MTPDEIKTRLVARWPAVFETARPLAIGSGKTIMAAAKELEIPKTAIRRWLRRWVSRTCYLKALATDGADRYDLEGNPVEPVSDDQRERALAELKRRLALRAKQPAKPRSAAPQPINAAMLGRPILKLKARAA